MEGQHPDTLSEHRIGSVALPLLSNTINRQPVSINSYHSPQDILFHRLYFFAQHSYNNRKGICAYNIADNYVGRIRLINSFLIYI